MAQGTTRSLQHPTPREAFLKLAAGGCPAPAFRHTVAPICLQAGCGRVSRTSFQAQGGHNLPSSWLRAGVPHQLSGTRWPQSAFKLAAGGCPAPAFRHKVATICLQAGCGPAPALRHKVATICLQAGCGLVSRTSFQAQGGHNLPSSWLRAGVPHQLSGTRWPQSAFKLAAGGCPAPAFRHKVAPICLQAGCGLVSRTSSQAQGGPNLPSSWLRAGVPHQLSGTRWPQSAFKLAAGWCPAPAFRHKVATICLQAGCARVSRTSFQAQGGHNLPSSWLRAGVPHQLSGTRWPQSAFKLAAGGCPTPAFRHKVAPICLQAGCGLVSRTSFQAQGGHNLPSSWLRVGVPHQLSGTRWPQSAFKLAAGWCPAPALRHKVAPICLQAGCGLVSRTSFQAQGGHNLPSSWLRAGVPHQLSSTRWPQSAFKLAAGWCPPAFRHKVATICLQVGCGRVSRTSFQAHGGPNLPSSWRRAGVPHQLSGTRWPQAAFKLAAGWCPAPAFRHKVATICLQAGCGRVSRTSVQAQGGHNLPSSWLRAGVPHQLSGTKWPQSAFKLAAGGCPAPAFRHKVAPICLQAGCGLVFRTSFQAQGGPNLPSSWLRAGVPHQLSGTRWPQSAFKLAAGGCPRWPQSAFKLAAGWCPAPAFRHKVATIFLQAGCGRVSRTSFQAHGGPNLPSSWLQAGVSHQLSGTRWPQSAFKLAARGCPAPASRHKVATICLQTGCGRVSRTSFQAHGGPNLPSSWLQAGVPHQLSGTRWPQSAFKLAAGGCPAPAFRHKVATICLQAGCGLVSRTSSQAQGGPNLPSSWLQAGVPHQLSGTRWPQSAFKLAAGQSAFKLAAGGCPAPAFRHTVAPICIQAGCSLVSRTSFQAQGGPNLPSSWLRAGVPHQLSGTRWWPQSAFKLAAGGCPAPAFRHTVAPICLQAGCGLVSRTSFQAQGGPNLPSSWLRAGVPHQLSGIRWPQSAFKLAAGWCPAPAFKHTVAPICIQAACRLVSRAFRHKVASICLQACCGLVSRTSFQAQGGPNLPSSWLRAGVPHQLSGTRWPQSACKLAAGWCPAPALRHKVAPICLQAGCGLVSRTSFQARGGPNLPSSWLRAGVPHQLSGTRWPQSAWQCPAPASTHKVVSRASSQAQGVPYQLSGTRWPLSAFKLAAGRCPAPFQAQGGPNLHSSWRRAGVPHQLSGTRWPQSACKLAAGWCPAPALRHKVAPICLQAGCGLVSRTSFQARGGPNLPSSWLRAGVPHQLSGTRWAQSAWQCPAPASTHKVVSRASSQAQGVPYQLSGTRWPLSAFKLAAGRCPAPFQAQGGPNLHSSWRRAGVPHQLSGTRWPQSAFKLAAGWCPAPAFRHEVAQSAFKLAAGWCPAPAFGHKLGAGFPHQFSQPGCRTSFQPPSYVGFECKQGYPA